MRASIPNKEGNPAFRYVSTATALPLPVCSSNFSNSLITNMANKQRQKQTNVTITPRINDTFTEMYDELSKIALKYKCTIIVPTQPNSERNYIVPQEFKDNPDILVIDYFDKI